ncbi:MAG: BCCT family transporter [Myxococcales bacterium]|nr:BCCT family transporter [Myxococcales bacterium]
MVKVDWARIEPAVFLSSAGVVLLVLGFGVADPARAKDLFLGLQDWIVGTWSWLFIGSTTLFLVFSIWCTFGARGALRLGPEGEPPTFALPSWFAMLFSAGMGIGIMFYGVAEPVTHYASPPFGAAETAASAKQAMTITFFHWGLHAWGVYAVMGLAIAYFGHRRGLPLAIRSTLYPLVGERIHGWLGHSVDVFAVFGTVFGLATSLGLGAMQINAGLARLFGAPESATVQIALIAVITAGATTSVVLGLDRGIRRLSELNVALATTLLVFVIVAGPTAAIVQALPGRLFDYAASLVPVSTGYEALGGTDWQKSWTLFYWAWWIAWSPFVGMFIARISRGRTIREFVLGVLFVPTLVSCIWFTVFGWSAVTLDAQSPGIVAAVENDISTGIYALLERLPASGITSLLAALVVAIFFVTSSDSGSFVVDMLTSGGHPDPPVWQRVFWAVSEGVVAAVLLLAGGLAALQSAAINTGLPFCVILIFVCLGLGRELVREGDGGH